jgi:hypothetical protein
MGAIFHFIHFVDYWAKVQTCVPSFISFIRSFFHPSIHLLFNHGSNMGAIFHFIHFVDYWAKVQTRVSSFISFIRSFFYPSIHLLFNHGSNMGAIFHFIHFVDYWAKVQTRVPSFISFICSLFANACFIFHFIHFVHWPRFVHSFIHSPWLPMWNLGVYVAVNAQQRVNAQQSHNGSLDITTFVIGW